MKIAVQMYTLRDLIKNGEDLLEILGKIKDLGYDGVEFAGYYGLDAQTLRARLDELGLECAGTHIGLENFGEPELSRTIEFHKALGCPNIGIPWANTSDEDCLEMLFDVIGEAVPAAQKAGLTVYYHNHEFEFAVTEDSSVDKLVIDRIKELCSLEVDTYWSFFAGVDNYKFLTENKDYILTVHIKDGAGRDTRALGEGECDLDAVLRGAKDIGLEWIIVENDTPSPDGLSDVARSIAYLKGKI